MRIGIDCRTILNPPKGEQAGVGHYTYYLIKNLLALDQKNSYILFFDSRFKKVNEFKKDNVKIVFFPFYQYKKYLPVTYSQMLISAVLSREKLDVFHSPANTLPLPYNKTSVVTIHDLAIYKFPKFFPTQFLNRQVFSTRVLVPKSLKKAAKIIAVSKNTKKDIIKEFGVLDNKIEVVYEGVLDYEKIDVEKSDFKEVQKKYSIKNKYILFLGTIEPRKNIVNLIKAFRNLSLEYDSPSKDYQLIIAGASGWKDQPIYKAIADANASILGRKSHRGGQDRRKHQIDTRKNKLKKKKGERRKNDERRVIEPVKYIGYVNLADKLSLLDNATCFVFPSLYEGFGLPVLEAMSLGTPVITSNLSSLPEVTGDKGALIVDPDKESELIDALGQILTDEGLRELLSINGKKQAQKFSWTRCANETLDVYKSVVK